MEYIAYIDMTTEAGEEDGLGVRYFAVGHVHKAFQWLVAERHLRR